MNLQCPLCKSHITIDDSLAGQTVQCPQCQGKFQAPMLFLDPEEEAARLAARALASAASAAPGAERGQAVFDRFAGHRLPATASRSVAGQWPRRPASGATAAGRGQGRPSAGAARRPRRPRHGPATSQARRRLGQPATRRHRAAVERAVAQGVLRLRGARAIGCGVDSEPVQLERSLPPPGTRSTTRTPGGRCSLALATSRPARAC
jgi:predicted Zn finger-like uncharacterized protein